MLISPSDHASMCAALVGWARGRDPVLGRYAVGSLSRCMAASAASYERVKTTGGVAALVAALRLQDGQPQCYAAGAIGTHGWALAVPVSAQVNSETRCDVWACGVHNASYDWGASSRAFR